MTKCSEGGVIKISPGMTLMTVAEALKHNVDKGNACAASLLRNFDFHSLHSAR